MIANKECYERGCACYDSRVDGEGIEVVAKHEWVGLTRNEILELLNGFYAEGGRSEREIAFARVIQRALKEKNNG